LVTLVPQTPIQSVLNEVHTNPNSRGGTIPAQKASRSRCSAQCGSAADGKSGEHLLDCRWSSTRIEGTNSSPRRRRFPGPTPRVGNPWGRYSLTADQVRVTAATMELAMAVSGSVLVCWGGEVVKERGFIVRSENLGMTWPAARGIVR
jgi:hypothetical protein